MGNIIRISARLGMAWLAALLLLTSAHAQTAEQLDILNQLPPTQRQQALQALQELQELQGQAAESVQQPGISEELTPLPEAPEALVAELPEVPEEPRAESGSRLIITLEPKPFLTPEEITVLERDAALRRITGSRFYELDASGVLLLQGLPNVPLLGLTAEAIEQRLGAEPSLKIFDVAVVILETESIGTEALTPFGYDIFEPTVYGFEPVTTGPVPPDYVLGPGDSIRVQLFGNVNGIYELEVSRDGVFNLPELGPMIVAGLPFSEFRADLNRRVQDMLIGTQVSVTMGQLRTIRVFVLGDARRPGSYVVSSLATISSALYRGGGISDIGSLRNIQLKRQGRVVARLDLYDLLLNGDTSEDRRLQPGDVIFVPPIDAAVGVSGAVRRPAIYELRGDTSISDVIRLAGGLLPEAFPDAARIERISASKERIVISVDVDSPGGAAMRVSDGDTLVIPEVLLELADSVVLAGHVQRPGPYQWRNGLRLTDLIPSAIVLSAGADANYVLIRRVDASNRRVHTVSANLAQAWADPRSPDNILLHEGDTVHVFSLAFGRQRVIMPILEELELQSRFGDPYKEVSVVGQVRAPGTYPLDPGMTVSDLIRAGGNLSEAAYALEAELTRYSLQEGERRQTELINISLGKILAGDLSADLALAPHDVLNVKEISQWQELESVSIEGEIRFPGTYPIRRGERLRSVIVRAGGLTETAFAEGAIFLRTELRHREQQQLEELAERLQSETALAATTAEDDPEAAAARQALLDQLSQTVATGRLVIDLPQILAGPAYNDADVVLKDGDRLLIPQRSQTVTIIGEVQYPTSHIYAPNINRNEYIDRSGGTTQNADENRIYVVRADGEVIASGGSRFFRRGNTKDIRPGDTIVVPLDADRVNQLTLWTNVSTIIYNIGVAAAAVASF